MRRKKKYINHKKERVVLSDILPYEIPVTFSNRYFYDFLTAFKIRVNADRIEWNGNDITIIEIVKLLFGISKEHIISTGSNYIEFNRKIAQRTIPFSYKISHNENDFRELTIIHPQNQLYVVEFYEKNKELILYYSNTSPLSIRKACRVASYVYHKDKTHISNLAHDHEHITIEEYDKEYESLKTFFVYKDFSNVYKFYESQLYHRCEKRYNKMFKFDISKCFDSIYSHSISWALLNREIVKDHISSVKHTFAGKFDILMQNLNYGETNGIIIGPEFSRIFAELILQQVDIGVLQELERVGYMYQKDYEIFRYVDDFFVFYNEESVKEKILQVCKLELKRYKLYLNESKTLLFEKPIITGITRAKQQIADLFNRELVFEIIEKENVSNQVSDGDSLAEKQYTFYFSSNRLITKFKAIIKETGIAYKDILNYTLSCIDRKVLKLIKLYNGIDRKGKNEIKAAKAILGLLEFTFFLYAVSPRVNTTIKLSMILSKLIKFVKIKNNFNFDNMHLIFKKIYDDIFFVLQKNKRSEYAQVETLYLLVVIRELGKEYRLDEAILCDYFNIDRQMRTCTSHLNYFSIVVLLFYIENKVRYSTIKEILQHYIKSRFVAASGTAGSTNTELTLLLLDLLACPYIDNDYKRELLSLYDITDITMQMNVIRKRSYWFTKWTEFNLGRELEAKRSQEVY